MVFKKNHLVFLLCIYDGLLVCNPFHTGFDQSATALDLKYEPEHVSTFKYPLVGNQLFFLSLSLSHSLSLTTGKQVIRFALFPHDNGYKR